ncbi:transposase [Streptomyces cellostaticus]|uniref:transposase n=1 Tax=Streptomyces cellostaticus TaxID=67285 RepID=UPI0020260566|nr:transposase [Streptomyces cellostaticus]
MLLFLLSLSDRHPAEVVRCRIDSKYALAMDLDGPGFHHSVLADLRDRLGQDDRADQFLSLALALDRIREAGMLKERGRQRTSSTPLRSWPPPATSPAWNWSSKQSAPRWRKPPDTPPMS